MRYTLARIDRSPQITWNDICLEKGYMVNGPEIWQPYFKEIRVDINDDGLFDVLRIKRQNREQAALMFYGRTTRTLCLRHTEFMKGLCKRAGIPPQPKIKKGFQENLESL